MIGLFLAAIYVGWQVSIGSVPIEDAVLGAAGFLYVWYWVFGVLVCGLIAAIATTSGVCSAATCTKDTTKAGEFLGLGVLSVFGFVIVAAMYAMLIVGSHCIATSGQPGMAFSDFDGARLGVGCGLLVVGMFCSRVKLMSNK